MFNGNPYLPQLQNMQNQLMQLQNNIPQPQVQQSVQIQFVRGDAGAKAFGIPASSSIILMDSSEPIFYMKSTDANGIETIKAYDFTEREITQTEVNTDKFVLKSDFEKLSKQVKGLIKSVSVQNSEKQAEEGEIA